MEVDWKETLRALHPQFQALAVRSPGLNHVFVESADDERDMLMGPNWLKVESPSIQFVDGKPHYGRWDVSHFSTMPMIGPSYRRPTPDESFVESDRVVRDQCGVVHAVFEPMRLRFGYLCGKPSEDASAFKTLANATANALTGAKDTRNHFLAAELSDFVQQPHRGIRYVFGEIEQAEIKATTQWT